MYKLKSKRPDTFDYDLIVIGSGGGGGIAAHIAAEKGKTVALIESGKLGGECPNFGCVPTKSILHSAQVYNQARQASRYGVLLGNVGFDYSQVQSWKNKAVHRTGVQNLGESYRHDHIHFIHGHAHFISPWAVAVAGQRLSAKQFLIASGAQSYTPPIPGLQASGFLNYKDALELDTLPKSIFIIGGGAIGSEFAHLFSSFDVKVHIADISDRLLSNIDQEAGSLIARLYADRGITVHLSSKVISVSKHEGKKVVELEKAGKRHRIMVDEMMVATGKMPNLDLGLDNADVRYSRRGVMVDRYLRTSMKHIFAAGDVVGPLMFTHTAIYQSRLAVHNMYSANKHAVDYRAIPICVFLDPEIACVGLNEDQLRASSQEYQVGYTDISVVARSNVADYHDGFVKVLADNTGRLLGACIAAPRAGEMIHELALAIQKGLKARDISELVHAFPTWSEAVKVACSKISNC